MQTNAVRLELFGNAEVDHVKLRLDSETWVQPLAGETMTDPAVIQVRPPSLASASSEGSGDYFDESPQILDTS